MRRLLIDDQKDRIVVAGREAIPDGIARSFQAGIYQLTKNGPWDVLYLDHDLGDIDEDDNEKTGYDIACFLEQNPQYAPAKMVCVSNNPSGRRRIEQVIENIYGTKRTRQN